jgi:hypothetical protein
MGLHDKRVLVIHQLFEITVGGEGRKDEMVLRVPDQTSDVMSPSRASADSKTIAAEPR